MTLTFSLDSDTTTLAVAQWIPFWSVFSWMQMEGVCR